MRTEEVSQLQSPVLPRMKIAENKLALHQIECLSVVRTVDRAAAVKLYRIFFFLSSNIENHGKKRSGCRRRHALPVVNFWELGGLVKRHY